ncbi:MAG: DUF2225 domain-containing protein [Candidatus Glassbacteria bacterium]|nr:DUF2225 domain-containing protein [Candidatus Glassbacteria bacterium]
MSEKKSPFVKKTVPCPMCSAQAENRFFLPKLFMEKGLESDRHVVEYKWLDDSFEDCNPPYYHFWFCPSCKYTATQKDFTKPTEDSDSNFNVLKRCYHKMNPAQKQMVQLLGGDIDFEKMNFSMAMKIHLLAVFIQQLVPEDSRDTSKLASYYLRIGWLFRERKAKGDKDTEMAPTMEFLEKISKLWTTVPRNEEDCLNIAASYFEKAYQSHPRYSDIVTASDLMLLIADLYLRTKDIKKAMQSINTVMQTGMKFRTKQGELIRKEKEAGNLTISRKAQIDAQTNRVNTMMDRAGQMRQDIVQMIIAKQEPKAKQVVAKMQAQGQDTEVIREKLKEMKFEPQLITKLLGEPKRKKFLGLF